ncbi:MAG: hypothetical protein KY432_06815 [Acidobacteria bacterium]|nr:hypothetical protein [Acidobacteriota bacterium]
MRRVDEGFHRNPWLALAALPEPEPGFSASTFTFHFDGPATSRRYFCVQFYLEDLLGCPVDLVTEKALRPELRAYIEQERVNV